jgi:hypothetical protein
MKFTNILKNIILETAKFDFLYGKYVKPTKKNSKGMLPFEVFKALIFADPTTRMPLNGEVDIDSSIDDMVDVKPGKYSEWIIKTFLGYKDKSGEERLLTLDEFERLFLEDLPRLRDLLGKYERYKNLLKNPIKKDINNVRSVEELSNLQVVVTSDGQTTNLETYRGKKIKKDDNVKVNKNFVFPGSEILKIGSDYTLIKISDKGELGGKAASFFGGYHNVDKGETNWCTSPENSSYSERYRKEGPLYIFIANDDKGEVGEITGLPTERYQIHFPSDQFKDRRNQNINFVSELLDGKFQEFKDLMKPEFAKNLSVDGEGEELYIKSLSEGIVGKFIALYWFDEIFDAQSKTSLKRISIENLDNNNLIITIPKTITEFVNLESISFENCIDKVPDFICQLSKLRLVSFRNNKKLTTLPSCISDLPQLTYFEITGSDNVKLPEELLDVADELIKGAFFISK